MTAPDVRAILADLFGDWWTGWDDEAGGPEDGLIERLVAADKFLAALEAAGLVICAEQVGIWCSDDNPPERMSQRQWEEERLVSNWVVEDEGGLLPEFAARFVAVYVPLPRSEP